MYVSTSVRHGIESYFSLDGGWIELPSPKIVINLSCTCKNLHCNRRTISVQWLSEILDNKQTNSVTHTHTDGHSVTFIGNERQSVSEFPIVSTSNCNLEEGYFFLYLSAIVLSL